MEDSSKLLSCLWRLHLYLLFWNQIFTCVEVSLSKLASCSLSGADRYLCCLNLLSNSNTCAWENSTLGFRRVRCFIRLHSPDFSEVLSLSFSSNGEGAWLQFPLSEEEKNQEIKYNLYNVHTIISRTIHNSKIKKRQRKNSTKIIEKRRNYLKILTQQNYLIKVCHWQQRFNKLGVI